ncbi:MAG TPA: membrane protein insertion efficiency factor YidD [Spongiibacteraceae bacterium]|nr:membrane protein insertion efficiency factor YidD [Spongiibacteraceae bacterium]
MNLAQRWCIAAIDRYQRSGGGVEQFRVACNFDPSCSDYARQAIERFGVWRGARLAFQRLRRCNRPDQVTLIADPVPASQGHADRAGRDRV